MNFLKQSLAAAAQGANPAPASLQPFHPPLGIHASYCMPHPTTLVLREKMMSFSGDDFSVKDQQGMDVVRVSSKYFAMRDKKTVTDARGQPIFTIETKILSLFKCQIGRDMSGREIFTVQKKFSVMGSKAEVTFSNLASDSSPILLHLSGTFTSKRAKILLNERVVATIQENWMSAKGLFTNDQTYTVNVAPGVDLALIAAICICFDEAENDKN